MALSLTDHFMQTHNPATSELEVGNQISAADVLSLGEARASQRGNPVILSTLEKAGEELPFMYFGVLRIPESKPCAW